MNIGPVRTEADHDWALSELAAYFTTPPPPGTAEDERLDVLVALIKFYKAHHWPIEPPDPVDAICGIGSVTLYGQARNP